VLPSELRNVVEVDRETLAKKLLLVANVTGDEARAVRLKLSRNDLEIFWQSVGRGEATAHLEVDYAGDAAEIAFNPDYVIEGIKNCETDVVRLEFNDRTRQAKFCLGESYVYIVMPITTDEGDEERCTVSSNA
jgi:DNA polymerase-3 subunit beta